MVKKYQYILFVIVAIIHVVIYKSRYKDSVFYPNYQNIPDFSTQGCEKKIQQTGATAGNLSVQIDKLSSAGYIEVEKTFKGRKPCTICSIISVGLKAFEDYVAALKSYL